MMGFSLSDDGSLELNPSIPSYVDEKGALLPDGDPRRIYADRAAALARVFVQLRRDPAADPRIKTKIDSAERRIVDAVPDGLGSAFGHRTAFNILHSEGILAEIVRKADGNKPPPRIKVPDKDYAKTFLSVIGPADHEAQSLPKIKQGRIRCDQLTSQVRHDLESARLKDNTRFLDKLQARARSMMQQRSFVFVAMLSGGLAPCSRRVSSAH
jgi:hypothetical protein